MPTLNYWDEDLQAYVPVGAQGDTGPPGPPRIKGVLSDVSGLPASAPDGDAYVVLRPTPSPPVYLTAAQLLANPQLAVDGQEIYLSYTSANSVVWHMRYLSGTGWQFVGGGPLSVYGQAASTTTATMFPFGTSLDVGLPGTYRIRFGAQMFRATTTEWLYVYLNVSNGVVGTSQLTWTRSTSGVEASLGLAMADQIVVGASPPPFRLQIANSNGSSGVGCQQAWMEITPVVLTP